MGKSGPSEDRDSWDIEPVDKSAGGWDAIPRLLLEDARLSLDTRAFTAWLLSRPRNWIIRIGPMPRLLKDNSSRGHVGLSKLRRFLRELEQAGYLKRKRMRSDDGCWTWRHKLRPVSTIDRLSIDGSSTDGKVDDIKQTVPIPNGINSDPTNQHTDAKDQSPAKTVTVGPDKEIRFPEVLSGEYMASAQQLISACPPKQCQAVLDEVAAAHRLGALRKSPLGFLYRLVERAKAGTFAQSYAMPYREKQRREASERQLLHDRRSQRPTSGPTPVGTIAEKALADLKSKSKDQEQ